MSRLLDALEPTKTKALDYWHGLSIRERQLLGLTLCLLLVWIVYFGLIRPVQSQLTQAQERLAQAQQQYDQVVEKAKQISVLKGAHPGRLPVSNQPLDALVNRMARQAGISITGLNRQQSSLQVRMSPARFSQLVSWLTQLKQQGVVITSLQIARTDKPGMVEVQQLRVKEAG